MSDRKKFVLFALAVVAVVCLYVQIQRSAKAYPENDIAAQNPIVSFKYKPRSKAEGRLEARLASGERLRGDYRLFRPKDTMGAENLYDLQEPDLNVAENYVRLMHMSNGANEGTHNKYRGELRGDRGTILNCEYYVTAFGHEGVGNCASSFGGIYQILF